MLLILLALVLLASPAQAEEPSDFCARIAERLDAMPDRETQEYRSHQQFFYSYCVGKVCRKWEAEMLYLLSKDSQTAWEAAKAGCFPLTL